MEIELHTGSDLPDVDCDDFECWDYADEDEDWWDEGRDDWLYWGGDEYSDYTIEDEMWYYATHPNEDVPDYLSVMEVRLMYSKHVIVSFFEWLKSIPHTLNRRSEPAIDPDIPF